MRHNCLVHHNQHRPMNEWRFESAADTQTIEVAGSFTANGIESLRQAAIAGVGILRASSFVVNDAIRSGRLVPILKGYMVQSDIPIFALYPSNRHLSPKIRAFIDYLDGRLSQEG